MYSLILKDPNRTSNFTDSFETASKKLSKIFSDAANLALRIIQAQSIVVRIRGVDRRDLGYQDDKSKEETSVGRGFHGENVQTYPEPRDVMGENPNAPKSADKGKNADTDAADHHV
ncbi:MAG: hypothetical protein OHK0017_10420 [Patescibacteria group bacterium]